MIGVLTRTVSGDWRVDNLISIIKPSSESLYSFTGTQSPIWSFSIKVCYSWRSNHFLKQECINQFHNLKSLSKKRKNAYIITFRPCTYSYPSHLHSWERTSSSRLCLRSMRSVMSGPKQQPPPLKVLGLQPGIGLGSLHSKSNTLMKNQFITCRQSGRQVFSAQGTVSRKTPRSLIGPKK